MPLFERGREGERERGRERYGEREEHGGDEEGADRMAGVELGDEVGGKKNKKFGTPRPATNGFGLLVVDGDYVIKAWNE